MTERDENIIAGIIVSSHLPFSEKERSIDKLRVDAGHAREASAPLSPIRLKRENFLRLAHKVADIALGNGANIVDPDHDPFTCETCAQIADLIIDFVTPDPDPFALSPSEEPAIEHFWTAVENGWDIEPRKHFEKDAVAMGFKSPVEMAVHHMWKRHAKVWPNEELRAASVPLSPAAQEAKG